LTAFAETRHEARLNECKKRHQRLSADGLKMPDPRWRGLTMTATEQPIDTGTAAGKCFLDMLGIFAQFETNLRHKRQLAGIARAKANGVYAGKGRPSSIDAAQVREMKAQGLGATEIAKELGVGRASGLPDVGSPAVITWSAR
jgi:hypothetical protein